MELDVEAETVDPCAWRSRAAPQMDVESSAHVRHIDMSAAPPPWHVSGPSNLAEVLHWMDPMLQTVLYHDTSGKWQANLNVAFTSILLYTDFSGIGFPESALSLLAAAWSRSSGLPYKLLQYRACDIMKRCREVHLLSRSHLKPLHVFGDIMRALPVDVMKEVKAKYAAGQQQFTAMVASGVAPKAATAQVVLNELYF